MTAASSLPALEAAKAAQEQGPEAFLRYHRRLFSAHFHEARDIGTPSELVALAQEEGLDPGPIAAALAEGRYREAVLREFVEATNLGIHAIPTVLFVKFAEGGTAKAVPVVGAVPLDHYRQALALLAE
jgi:predicted DsbA family dithiol-disulfide isomerase